MSAALLPGVQLYQLTPNVSGGNKIFIGDSRLQKSQTHMMLQAFFEVAVLHVRLLLVDG